MANLIQAIQKFGPKLRLNNLVAQNDLAEWIAMRTGQTPGEVALMLLELAAAVLYFNRRGTPVKLAGLGVFSPTISRNGKYRIKVRTDPALVKGINADAAFNGRVLNRDAIGLDNAGFKALWDAEHPDDPLEI
jgi:HU domain fused to wHTH, Ig, or Glycine-rich motif